MRPYQENHRISVIPIPITLIPPSVSGRLLRTRCGRSGGGAWTVRLSGRGVEGSSGAAGRPSATGRTAFI